MFVTKTYIFLNLTENETIVFDALIPDSRVES